MAENPLNENSSENEEPSNIIAEAFSNFQILKNISSHLNNEDLDSCSQVWKNVAEPMIVQCYDIQLKSDRAPNFFIDDEEGFFNANQIVMKKRTCKSNDEKERTYNFREGSEKLSEIIQREKITINLTIAGYGDFENNKLNKFLPKFGPFVSSLYVRTCEMTASRFCQEIVKDFPNLEYLNFYRVYLLEDTDREFNPQLPENQLLHLKKINLKGAYFRNSCLMRILSIAPNLQEIRDFPIILTQSLIQTQKAGLVKSICYKSMYCSQYNYEDDPYVTHDETYEAAVEKFAQLSPKLDSFTFEIHGYIQDFLSLPETKPHVFKLFQSSYDSLRSLTLLPSVSFSFQDIPPLTSLKKIKFILKSDLRGSVVPKIFPEEVLLQKQFPNVTEIDIRLAENKFMGDYFPGNVFSPWGAQILKLKVCLVDADRIKLLGKLFPSVRSFGFEMVELPDNLHSNLEAISKVWPQVESIHIKIDEEYVAYWGKQEVRNNWKDAGDTSVKTEYKYKVQRGHSLDSAITGISEHILRRLNDSISRGKFPAEEIQELQEASTIRKLKNLRCLKFDFDNCYTTRAAVEKLSTLTPISHEFGFEFLPELKVIVRARQDFQMLKDMRKSFEPFKMLEIETEPLIPILSP